MTNEHISDYNVDFEALDAQMSDLGINTLNESSDVQVRTLKDQLTQPTEGDNEHLLKSILTLFDHEKQMVYPVGFNDDGSEMNLNDEEVKQISETLKKIAQHESLKSICELVHDSNDETVEGPVTAKIPEKSISKKKNDSKNNRILHYLFRRIPEKVEDVMEIRVAVIGNVDAGKSTVLGVLTRNVLDNGRGLARSNVFRHKHEIESGRTSSIGIEILGYDKTSSKIISNDQGRVIPWSDISSKSSKVIVFHDLAGHEKYLRTTVFGLTGGQPDAVMLVVGANAGMIGMAKEHLGLSLALNVPVYIVVTKIDMCPPNVLESTLKQLMKLLKSSGCRKVPLQIRNKRDVVSAAMHSSSGRTCPIFMVSNLSGEGLDLLRLYMNLLPPSKEYKRNTAGVMEIRESYSVPFVGTVVSGVVWQGAMHTGDQFWLGPNEFGQYTTTQIKSIHYNRVSVPVSYAGQSASFALKRVNRSQARKGLVLIEKTDNVMPPSYMAFEADILILYHSTTISLKYQAVLHCRAVRQTAKVLLIKNKDTLRTGDRATVVFKFLARPEYLEVGSKIIFREGRTKGVGHITKLLTKEEELEATRLGELERLKIDL
ncbi:hypothetical protein BB559_006444 [Furculomyces boomerangus]|uniref:Tr-type G domain-containing protein n=1 Tax=Furculomyces boomerangus TaxID=61424 RepID=A0A2T9Y2Y1_9FUNG|nr:hypothetical protein BB559_006444 [Furculomyces boomerangus]